MCVPMHTFYGCIGGCVDPLDLLVWPFLRPVAALVAAAGLLYTPILLYRLHCSFFSLYLVLEMFVCKLMHSTRTARLLPHPLSLCSYSLPRLLFLLDCVYVSVCPSTTSPATCPAPSPLIAF